MNDDLIIALEQIVHDFGTDIINDKNLANIVADYYSFDRNPAVRNILKTLVSEGYAVKIGQLKSSKGDPCIDLERYTGEIEQSWGYGKEQVRYVLSCIASSIGIEYIIDNSKKTEKPSILLPSQKRNINSPNTKKNPNVPAHNLLQPPTNLDSLFVWTSKIKYWHLILIFSFLFVVVGVVIVWSAGNRLLAYGLMALFVIPISGFCYGVEKYCPHINQKYLELILVFSCILGLSVGLFGGCSFNEKREERREARIEEKINDMINKRDTLALSNYIRNSEYSTLDYWKKHEIENKYDSLKCVMLGCDKIIDNLNAHMDVLKAYGLSDTSLKEIFSDNFFRIIKRLLYYQPTEGQVRSAFMINKLTGFLRSGHFNIYGSIWKDFNYIDPNTVVYKNVLIVKAYDNWRIDDIYEDGHSLKEIFVQYINGK